MPSLEQAQNQLRTFVGGLSFKQQALLAGAVLVTVAVLAVFVHFIGTPDYKPLVTGMEKSDAEALGSRLAAKNIQYQISSDGKTLSVPSDQLDSSRMEVASQGMPRSGRLGFELFDKMNWGQTEFDEKVNYQRALEGELERSIQTLKDVESVRVHLVMASDSLFLDRERSAKASVVLKLRSAQLSPDTQMAISRLVAGAVDRLDPDNVTVIDADTNQPIGLRRHGTLVSGDLEQQLSSRLVSTLQPIVGSQHIQASVNVEYDPSSSEENQETYDPQSAVAVSMQKSEEQVGGALAGGVPGTSSNVPGGSGAAKAATVSGDGSQMSKSESSTFAVNKTIRHILQPPGRIRRISAALLVDEVTTAKLENGQRVESRRKRSQEELKQIEDLARAAIGLDTNRGDVLSVQEVSFEQAVVSPPGKPTIVQRVRVTLNDFSAYVRYAALMMLFLFTYWLLLRPMKKQLLATFRALPGRIAAPLPASPVTAAIPVQNSISLSPEQQKMTTLKQELIEKVKAEPAATSRLIQGWLQEEAK